MTMKNRTNIREKGKPFMSMPGKFVKKDFTTFSKNVMNKHSSLKMDVYKKIKVFDGFDLNSHLKSELQSQREIHENLFKIEELKEQFVSFSKTNFFFKLEDQKSSNQSFDVTNNSEFYHFKITILLKSKEFKVDFQEVYLRPKETKSVLVHFNPLQTTLFHSAKLDVIVTNEKISDVNYQDLKKKNLIFEIQKRQVNNCFLGDIK